MDRDVVVLRGAAPLRPREPLALPSSRSDAEDVSALTLETATLGRSELRDVVRDPAVRAVAPVMPTRLVHPVPSDGPAGGPRDVAAPGPTWGVRAVGADRSPRTGAGVRVAVLDTGIDDQHPAFAGVTLVQKDFSGDGDGDRQGHGTHCAGTVLGRDVDGTRIGVAPGVTDALVGKVLRDSGSGDSGMIFRGLQWAMDEGAAVISMSIGFDFPGMVAELVRQGWPADLATSAALEGYRANLRMFDALMAVARAHAAFGPGSILVAAAGNESRRDVDPDHEIGVSIPAAADGVVSVGALAESTGAGLTVAPFSNTFPTIAGPGVGVLSARAGSTGLVALNGTSMATPHVAGVLALWWEDVVTGSELPVTAATVLAQAVARADVTALAGGVDVADRGVGLVQAP